MSAHEIQSESASESVRFYCHHCDRMLPRSTFYRHRLIYFDEISGKWMKQEEIGCLVSDDEDDDDSGDENENEEVHMKMDVSAIDIPHAETMDFVPEDVQPDIDISEESSDGAEEPVSICTGGFAAGRDKLYYYAHLYT